MLDTTRSKSKTPDDVATNSPSESSCEADDKSPRKVAVEENSTQHTSVARLDPITDQLTVFAPSRENRPNSFQLVRKENEDTAVPCPFCSGAENETPDPVWVGRAVEMDGETQTALADCGLLLSGTECIDDPDILSELPKNDWAVRVVPNKYPAIRDNGTPYETEKTSSPLFQEKAIQGGHEVIIESPRHHRSIVDLDVSNVALVFAAYRDRIRRWSKVTGTQYISVFKNAGGDAGASLPHCHSQLIATNQMPPNALAILKRMSQYRARTGCCLQCDLLRAELKEKTRIIAKTDSLVAYCPFASRFPMMVRITTTQHNSHFETLEDKTIESVAYLVKRVASWIEFLRPGASYNYLLHTQPPGSSDSDSFHWSLEIFPRLTRMAGFEFSSDCMINPIMPEDAAAEFRTRATAEDPRVVL